MNCDVCDDKTRMVTGQAIVNSVRQDFVVVVEEEEKEDKSNDKCS